MPLAHTRELVADAHRAGGALAAFNVITLEHAQAVAAGAEAAGAPAVLQVSENAAAYHGGSPAALAAALTVVARKSAAPLALHLDHVVSPALLETAPATGFSSVMIDASRMAYADNVATTARAVHRLHAQGLLVEAELGEVGGKPGQPALDAHAPGARTDPAEAAAYVRDTGVDALAVAVGNAHAMTERTAALDHALISELRESVGVPLVLHGSSGVPDAELRRAVTAGMTKINIGTALNTALTAAVRAQLADRPELVDPRRYLGAGREAMAQEATRLLRVLTSPPAHRRRAH